MTCFKYQKRWLLKTQDPEREAAHPTREGTEGPSEQALGWRRLASQPGSQIPPDVEAFFT